ncbi:MAG: GPW/gp25 family protein [Bacteroidota bacterium]
MMEQTSFLGTGWSFPPRFNRAMGAIEMVSDVEDIKESLSILLSTTIGERVLQAEYGCNLEEMVFEPINRVTLLIIEDMVRTAILYYEARINPLDITVSDANINEGVLEINVAFEIRGTNTRFNFVYPFYLEEGTDINLIA